MYYTNVNGVFMTPEQADIVYEAGVSGGISRLLNEGKIEAVCFLGGEWRLATSSFLDELDDMYTLGFTYRYLLKVNPVDKISNVAIYEVDSDAETSFSGIIMAKEQAVVICTENVNEEIEVLLATGQLEAVLHFGEWRLATSSYVDYITKVFGYGFEFQRYSLGVDEQKFANVYRRWRDGELTAVRAMEIMGLKRSTFYRRVKEYEEAQRVSV